MRSPFSSDVLPVKWRFAREGYAFWSFLLAALFAAAIAYDLLRMPVQVYDSLGEILAAQRSPDAWTSFWDSAGNAGYLRPLRIAQIKLLFDAAHGHYWLVYRGWHALWLCLAFLLFARAMRVRTPGDLAAAAFALTVWMGAAPFRGLVQEAFPINHFLEIVVACLFTLNLSQSRGGWWVDACAALTFAASALTLESGLLVWVVAASARLIGLRGISTRGVGVMTVLVAGYFYLRFVHFASGVPALTERSAGFLFAVLDPTELVARFGAAPFVFYSYNVAASMSAVLLSEPRNGVFVAVRSWFAGDVPPHVILAFASTIPTSLLIAWASVRCAATRSAEPEPRDLDVRAHTAGLLVVAGAVVCANALISFAYAKDEVLSVAAAFYALAAFAAVRLALVRSVTASRSFNLAVAAVLVLSGSAWAIRSAGVHHILRLQAFRHQFDWAVRPTLANPVGGNATDARSIGLMQALEHEAVRMRVQTPHEHAAWAERVWGE